MYEFPDIMEKYKSIPKDHPNRKYEVVKLCLEKYQYILDHGGMDYHLGASTCPACQEWGGICSWCVLGEVEWGYYCGREGSPWHQMLMARNRNDQSAFTEQVKWFVAFFEKWLAENAPTITEVLQ